MLQTAVVAGERLGEILDLELEKGKDEDKKIMPSTSKGNIEFKNLDFRYGTRQLVLKDINLTINSGEKIALVGESGSGKTTITKLLMNFYQCEKGELLINGYNIKDINIEALREKIAYISQETFLFNGTIIENTMHEFSEGITTIVIAHRLSTIMRCDKIYVLDKGEIKESGTHNGLIESKGMYYDLCKD